MKTLTACSKTFNAAAVAERRGGSGGGGGSTTRIGKVTFRVLRAGTFSKLTFGKDLLDGCATVFRTTALALAFVLSVLTALAAETTRLVIFLLAAALGDDLSVVVLCSAFATGLDVFETAFFDATTFEVAFTDCAAEFCFAVVRDLDFGVEGGFGFDKAFPLGFVNLVAALL